jgi:quercetin dioxygenase-like cupin family protein
MINFEQLNVYSWVNHHGREPQQVHLFHHEELKAELVVLPPGATKEWQGQANCDELFDVLAGQGTFHIEGQEFCGGPGKSVLVYAGAQHSLQNHGAEAWILRVTYHERLSPRHIGKLIARTIRKRLGIV